MYKKFTLFFLFIVSFFSVADTDEISLHLTLSKIDNFPTWRVDLDFSSPIEELNFETTPYIFIKNSWSSNSSTLNLSTLELTLKESNNKVSYIIKGANDSFIPSFYTPFINFSDESHAIYIGHLLPNKINLKGKWIPIINAKLRISINTPSSEPSLFNGIEDVKNAEISVNQAMQYAYIGKKKMIEDHQVNLIQDIKLPSWIKNQYAELTPKLLNYYSLKTNQPLDYKPAILMNFKPSDEYPRADGGVGYHQIALNHIGNGWAINPEDNKFTLAKLLAHEVAHLWNSQYWSNIDMSNNAWLHEGGAEYFAMNALLDLGFIKQKDIVLYQRKSMNKCLKLIDKSSVNQLQDRQVAYICGETLFYLASSMISKTDPFYVWNELVSNKISKTYGVDDFFEILSNNNVDKLEIQQIKQIINVAHPDNMNILLSLLKKHLNLNNNQPIVVVK